MWIENFHHSCQLIGFCLKKVRYSILGVAWLQSESIVCTIAFEQQQYNNVVVAHRRQVFLELTRGKWVQVLRGSPWTQIRRGELKRNQTVICASSCILCTWTAFDGEYYSLCKAGKVKCTCFLLAPRTTLSPKHKGRVQLPRPMLANCSKVDRLHFCVHNGFIKKKQVVEMSWKIIELKMWICLGTFEQFFLKILLIFNMNSFLRNGTFI